MNRKHYITTLLPTAVLLFALLPACQSSQPAPQPNTEKTERGENVDSSPTPESTANAENSEQSAKAIDTTTILPGSQGCVEGNCVNGEGVYVYSTGDVYRGQFTNGNRDGKGSFEYANGDRYDGNFKENKRTGFGSYTFSNGDKYVGEFNNGQLKGIGTYRFTDGTQLKGTFTQNGTTGEGILVEDDIQSNEKGRDCTVENRLLFCRN
ncbi:MAG: hypothetical protein NXI24_00710 [bacterium]|nr:hypothetical protein [bacterium]